MFPDRRHARELHGRDAEVGRILRLLRGSAPLTITITGPIGIGKSALLEEIRRRAPRGVVFEGDGRRRVVTRAVALGVRDEHEIALPPLDAHASIRLLADAARLDLDLLAGPERAALARLAAESEGHPEVLEHLAARLAIRSPSRLARALLHGGTGREALAGRDLSARLRAATSALDRRTRKVARALAATTTSFALETAEALVDVPVDDAIERLIAAGLVIAESRRFVVLRAFRPFLGRSPRARARLTRHLVARLEAGLPRGAIVESREEIFAALADARRRRWSRAEISLACALGALARAGDPEPARLRDEIEKTLDHRGDRAALVLAHGDAAWFAGDAARAARSYARAEAAARRSGDRAARSLAAIRRATVSTDLGTIDEGLRHLARGRRFASPKEAALAHGIEGRLRRARDDHAGALVAYERQEDAARALGDGWLEASAIANRAECHDALGAHDLALALYARARRKLVAVDRTSAAVIDGYAGLLSWRHVGAAAAIRFFRAALRTVVGPRYQAIFAAAHAAVLAETGDHMRAARQLTVAEEAMPDEPSVALAFLIVTHARADAASRAALRPRIELELAKARFTEHEGSFRAALRRCLGEGPAAKPVDRAALSRHPRLVALLALLEANDAPLSPQEIFARLWPDERVPATTAAARVRKAISLLRGLGMAGTIVTVDGRYLVRRAGAG
jgi:predicted negative regulator of RcsB-dependent stress response